MVGADAPPGAALRVLLLGPPESRRRGALRARASTSHDLGIADVADRLPGELPYGTQKRVALARALVAEPACCCSTSPPRDWPRRRSASSANFCAGCGSSCAVMLVEHHMDLVMDVCDLVRRARLRQGHRARHARRDPRRPRRDRRLPRRDGARCGRRGAAGMTAMLDVHDARAFATARCAHSTGHLHGAPRAPSPPCSAPTAPARPPCCVPSADWCGPVGPDRDVGPGRSADGRSEEIVRLGMAHVPGGPRHHRRTDRRGEPPPRRLWRRDRSRPESPTARCSRRWRRGGPGAPRRCPVANGRCWPIGAGADQPTETAAARRTVARARATPGRRTSWRCCRKLRDETGLTVLLVEQNARSALSVADRAVVLNLGRKWSSTRRTASFATTTNSATPTWGSDGSASSTSPSRASPPARCTPRSHWRWC